MAPRLDGKVALITGASRGIGSAIGRLFLKEGAKVMLSDIRDVEDLELVKAVRSNALNVGSFHLDVTSEDDWKHTVDQIVQKFGRLDILVNNAGVAVLGNEQFETLEAWRYTMDINAKGAYLGMKHVLPQMVDGGGGSVINVSSIAAIIGGRASLAYRASKGALRALSRSMAIRMAPKAIRINSIFPGDVETPLNREYLSDPNIRANRISAVPIGRLGQPIDIAFLAVYLASDESSFVTGAELVIDGGRTAY